MEGKRIASVLIPYKIVGREVFVYLQKRTEDAERFPGCFGLFGGGVENTESPEEALRREIKEELNFVPEHYEYLGMYEFEKEDTRHVYFLEVRGDFESTITVLEGECGRYFSEKEVLNEPKVVGGDRVILKDVFARVRDRI